METNSTISANGGHGLSHPDGSGAGGSGGSIRIQASEISNFGKLEAKGGNALGEHSMAGPGGGGRIALITDGSLQTGDTNSSGGNNMSVYSTTYRSEDLVGYWKLDETASSSTAVNTTGNTALNGTISGNPDRRTGVKGGAFYFDGSDDKIIIPYNPSMELDSYTVSFWYYPERKFNATFTGLFGRATLSIRNYAIWQGNSGDTLRPFIHHRFSAGQSYNEGVANRHLTEWKKWYHIVCSNEGLGGYARTYLNGSFTDAGKRYDFSLSQALTNNPSGDLHIGVSPDNANSGYFKGMIDDIRLYDQAFGAEDVQHLFQGDPENIYYITPRDESKNGSSGTITTIEQPIIPALALPSLTVGDEVKLWEMADAESLEISISGFPQGLSNRAPFSPKDVSGLFAWYQSDQNDSFQYHLANPMERNDTVAPDDLLLMLSFEEANGTEVLDKSGNNHHARILDQSFRASGKSGLALHFDGENDGLVFSKIQYLDQPDEFSISFWFRRNADNTTTTTNHGVNNLMVAQSSADFNDNFEIGSEGDEIEIYLDSGTGAEDANYQTSGASLTDGVWHHLTMTYGTNLKVFVDGNSVLEATTSGPLDSSQDSPLSLGMARVFSDQWGDFNGSIDDFRIYRKELNATEVDQLYGGGNGDFLGTVSYEYNDGLISKWKDLSGNERHAKSVFIQAPKISFDPSSGKKLLTLDYGKRLTIPDAISMPVTLFIYGKEKGLRLQNREHFTFEGWRLTNNNLWTLGKWDNNNPYLNSNLDSTFYSVVAWTISRYGYELRVNGKQAVTNASANWNPDALFDRINGDGAIELGELIIYPGVLEDDDKLSVEGHLGHRWGLNQSFPDNHPYRVTEPEGQLGLILRGSPKKAGTFTLTATASNMWGSTSQDFNMTVMALPQEYAHWKHVKLVPLPQGCLQNLWTQAVRKLKSVFSGESIRPISIKKPMSPV